MTTPKSQRELLQRTPKAIVHLRAQLIRGRLGLIFGSGASKELGFPDWNTLVRRIAEHKDVKAIHVLTRFGAKNGKKSSASRSLTSLTQMLFNEFRQKSRKKRAILTYLEEQRIKTEWLKIIHLELYKDIISVNRKTIINKHSYLKHFVKIIKNSPLTVNYNFDDTLEKLLMFNRDEEELNKTRGYETTDKPNEQFQKQNSVIYHPNGFIPSVFEDGTSPDVVFADDAFQDQIVSAATGKYLHLSNHLFRNTCLLIGLSLEDSTLQSLLRQNAVKNPGNIHYMVHFKSSSSTLTERDEKIIFQSNFNSYNLYTMFLDNEGIRDLASLISMSRDDFSLEYSNVERKFVYYVIGSVGSGKSTAANNFRSLLTYDEWIDERKPELAVPEKTVSPSSKRVMNNWIAEQFRKKNFALSNYREGIHLVDRCPLDPLTFGSTDKKKLMTERKKKARALIDQITSKNSMSITRGHIIHLDCDVSDVRIRNSLKHKYWEDGEYTRLLSAIEEIYGGIKRSIICTRGRSPQAVAHEIAKVIFLEDYHPVDLGVELEKYTGGS